VTTAPQRIGELEVVRRIGAGGFGVVYLADDRRLQRKVALKLAHPGRGDLWREARAAARLAHPNVVTIYEIGEHEGNPYVVMEYVDGPTLRDRLARGPVPLAEALAITRDLASAIAAAHREGVVHRDLTPANVLLAPDGRARVVDFGLARAPAAPDRIALGSDVGLSLAAGTPLFMAPEQWRGEALGPAADVWALGAIAHLLVTGAPHVDGGVGRVRERVTAADELVLSPALAHAPREVAELVAACLRKDPAARPTAAEAARRLDALLARGPHVGTDPFRGAAAFTDGDAAVFHGRAAETAAIVERLATERVVTITGPAGAGKTSLVQAGVVPALRRAGWRVAIARPGADPLRAIADALFAAGADAAVETCTGDEDEAPADAGERAARWVATPALLAADLADTATAVGGKLALVVDPLDDLEAVAGAAGKAAAAALAAAIADDGPARLIFTLRDDGVAAVTARLGGVPGTRVPLAPPDRDALAAIVEGSIRGAGYDVEAAVVASAVDEVAGRPDALARLQARGQALWAGRDRERRVVGAPSTSASGPPAIVPAASARPSRRRRVALVAFGAGAVAAAAVVFAAAPSPPATPPAKIAPAPIPDLPCDPGACTGGKVCVDHRCRVPQCRPLAYPKPALFAAVNAEGMQDAIEAISLDGTSVLSLRRRCDRWFSVILIDGIGDESAQTTLNLTKHPSLAGFWIDHMTLAMSADALTVIGIDAARTGFLTTSRTARGRDDFAPATTGPFAALAVRAPAYMRGPVLTADGLAFYYRVFDEKDPAADGIYESVRTSTAEPFPPGRRLGGAFHGWNVVTGVSADRMTIFVDINWQVIALTRDSLDEPYQNPNAPMGAPLMPGARIRPFGDCTQLVGTCTTGCNNEETCLFSQ
jgi:predicted Ser/Thr protein kinase